MKPSFVIFGLVLMAALAVSPAYANSITFDKSDQAILYPPNSTNSPPAVELDEPDEPQTNPGAFFDTIYSPLFKQDAGVIFFLEPGSVAPTGTYIIGQDSLSSLVSLASLSDVFGLSNQLQNPLNDLGFYSGNPNSTFSDFESFGITGQTFTFMLEPDAAVDLSSRFLTAGAIDNGYILTFRSDVSGDPRSVPDTGTTLSFFGLSLMGVAFLRRKLC